MNQINVTPPSHTDVIEDTSGDRTAAAGINMITVLIILAVLAVVAWYLFTGPLRTMTTSTGSNVTVNNPPPAQQAPTINVNPPAQQPANPPANQGGGTAPQPPAGKP